MPMTPAQLEAERRRGRYAGAAAIGAGLLLIGEWVWALILNKSDPKGDRGLLLHFHRHASELVAVYAIRALALALLLFVTVHMYRAAKARQPSLNRAAWPLGLFGPAVFAISTLASAIALSAVSSDYGQRSAKTVEAAQDALRDSGLIIAGAFGLAAQLALGFWFVVVALAAMRIRLLGRFMAVLGILIGPLLVLLPSSLIDPVLALWLLAIGSLFLGLWRRGIPPAWEAGEEVPWPSPLGERARQTGEVPPASSNGEVEPVGPGATQGGPRRKRKRRRR